jgi:hypothetical protein
VRNFTTPPEVTMKRGLGALGVMLALLASLPMAQDL